MNNNYLDYLQHHGVTGMHWGQQNGPRYPLSPAQEKIASIRNKIFKKKKNGEKVTSQDTKGLNKIQGKTPAQKKIVKKIKSQTINEAKTNASNGTNLRQLASPQDVYKYRSALSDKELADYLKRYDNEQRLLKAAQDEYKSQHKVQVAVKEFLARQLQNTLNGMAEDLLGSASNDLRKAVKGLYSDKKIAIIEKDK